MIIIKTEYAHSLKPEFIKKVVQHGWVRTRSGYEYERRDFGYTEEGVYFITITRKEPLTNAVHVIARVEVRE